MRIPSVYGSRTISSNAKNEKPKIYLMYEGEQTEVQYFNALIDKINNNDERLLFEVVPLLRSFEQHTNSHPNNILEQIKSFISDEHKLNEILTDYLIYELGICEAQYTETEVIEIVSNICSTVLGNHKKSECIKPEEILTHLGSVFEQYFSTEAQIEHFKCYLESQTTFGISPDDSLCLIIDGDHKSVCSNENYSLLKSKVKELGIKLYVTKPNFEFWLLLHSENISKYNDADMLANRKVNSHSHKRYLECALSREFGGYNKSRIHASRFIEKLDIALKQVKKYCQDINELNEKLGSNLGLLIEPLVNGKSQFDNKS